MTEALISDPVRDLPKRVVTRRSNFILMNRPLDFDNRLRNPRHDGDSHLVRLNIQRDG